MALNESNEANDMIARFLSSIAKLSLLTVFPNGRSGFAVGDTLAAEK
jgi:hypothetical protein